MKSFTIDTPDIFSPEECLFFLERSSKEVLYHIESHTIRRLLSYKGELLLVEVNLDNAKSVMVNVMKKEPSQEEIEFTKYYVINWLGLTTDLTSFYEMASKDRLLMPLVKRFNGLRLIGIPDLFEALSWAIIGQQINLSFAYTIKKRFVEHFGEKLTLNGKTYYHFPKPEAVAEIKKTQLLDLKFSRQKADYILGISKNFLDGTINDSALRKMNYKAAKSKLLSLYGIGNWSADYVLMKTMHHPEAFPVSDAGFLNALKAQLGLDSKPDIHQIHSVSASWKGHEALATFYLWRSLMD